MATRPCTGCSGDFEKKLLTVKKVLFTEMGPGAQTRKSRVVGHLCPQCVVQDPDYRRDPYKPVAPVAAG